MNDKDPTVLCEEVTKIYRQGSLEVRALRGVSLRIETAEFLCLTGPSGSGKTTLLNLIGGLDTPTTGKITVAGHQMSEMSKGDRAQLRLRKIGLVFQAYNLMPVLTALENVELVMQLQGVSRSERRSRARAVLQRVGLAEFEHRRPAELSGGEQQRVAVARAIASDPVLVLADEPTANLDSETAAQLLELMQELNRRQGVSFIFSTHDELVMSYAKRRIRLRDGIIA